MQCGKVCLELEIDEALKKRLENAEASQQTEDGNINNQPTKLRTGEVFEVMVVGHKGETNAENPANDWDSEEEGIGEVAPH